jgi:hypothetical protein
MKFFLGRDTFVNLEHVASIVSRAGRIEFRMVPPAQDVTYVELSDTPVEDVWYRLWKQLGGGEELSGA